MTHVFFRKAYKQTLVIPNRIVVKSRDDDSEFYSGEAIDAESYALLPKTKYVLARLESDDQAEDIAEALLAKAKLGCDRGSIVTPMNVAQEVADYVKVTDQRQGDERVGNVGYIHRKFGKDKWEMTWGVGNWFDSLRYQKILKELEVYTGQYFERLSVGNLYAEHIQADSLDMVWIDPDGNIDLSLIGDNLDNLPDGEVYARIKSMHLDAGVLQLNENVVYKAGYDPNTKRRNFTATPMTPYDLGDMWTDGTVLKRCTTARATGAYVAGDWTQVSLDAIADGSVYHRVKSAALSASGLVLLDQVTVGTYGLVKSTDISAGHIVLSACAGDLDDIDNGTTYGKLNLLDIDAGHIKLSSYTKVSGEWYDEAGVEIDAAHGINIYGTNQALTTRATKTGTIQCYVGSDGCIYAGAGNVKLSQYGLILKGSAICQIYSGSTYIGDIGALSTGLSIATASGKHLFLYSGGSSTEIVLALAGIIRMSGCPTMILPTKTSAPSSPEEGMAVFNSTTGYWNVYHSGAWWHANRDAGWA